MYSASKARLFLSLLVSYFSLHSILIDYSIPRDYLALSFSKPIDLEMSSNFVSFYLEYEVILYQLLEHLHQTEGMLSFQ